MRRVAFVLFAVALASGCGKNDLKQARPQLVQPPSPQDFGKVPVLVEKRLEIPIQNLGRAALEVTNVALAKEDGVFSIVSQPSTVATGNIENVIVAFSPLKEVASENTLSFDTNDPDVPHVDVTLTGEGSTRALMEWNPASLDFGRVAECGAAVQQLTLISKGTADLVIEELGFTEGTDTGFSFVGSTKVPATVKAQDATGLPGQLELTVKYSAAMGSSGTVDGGIHLKTTDPDHREVTIPLSATINEAPVAVIAPLGNGAPGQTITLDGTGSSDPDGDTPITYKWTLRSKPLSSNTTIAAPTQASTSMALDPLLPGAYEVQLDVADSQGVKSCQPARAQVVAAPAQKLLIEVFWDNPDTDLDLHVLRNTTATIGLAPDDCYYQNRTPDWGQPGTSDDPELSRDALTGYGPEVFGYVNPIDATFRVVVFFANDHLTPTPASKATLRVYEYGVLKAELSKTLVGTGDIWVAADVTWPSGQVVAIP